MKSAVRNVKYYFVIEYNTECRTCITGKGKVIPLQAWTGPESSRRLRLPDFKTVSI